MTEMPKLPLQMKKLGGGKQFVLRSAKDLQYIDKIDEALWGAVRVNIDSLNGDRKFLTLIDCDKDGVLLPEEVVKSWHWVRDILIDHSILAEDGDTLPIGVINPDSEEGTKIIEAAKRITSENNSALVDLPAVRTTLTDLASGPLKGDGIISEEAVSDPETAELLRDIITCGGGTPNAGGKTGVNAAALEAFLNSASGYLEWLDGNSNSDNLPFGEETATNYAAMAKLREKIDTYFTYCELVSLNQVNMLRFETNPESMPELDISKREDVAGFISGAPIAQPDPGSKLPLTSDRINPAWRDAATHFADIFKVKILTPDKWQEIKQSFVPYEAYLAGKTGSEVEQLGSDKLRRYLERKEADLLTSIIAEDTELGSVINMFESLEKLVLFRIWFFRFLNNYLSLAELFTPNHPSMIQAGSLIIDGYRMDMCIKVNDPAQHKKMAENSNIRIIYLQVSSLAQPAPLKLAVAVTAACGIKRLFIGKQALFIDDSGKQWDAKIIDTLDAPVTLREIIFQPLIKIRDFIKARIEKFSSASLKNVDTQLAKGATAPPAPSSSSGGMMLLGGGIGIAAVGSSLAYLITALCQPKVWQGLLVVLFLFILIMVIPIIIAGIIRLRNRSLARFLEAAGWAVNPVIRLTRKTGRIFTHPPKLPMREISKQEIYEIKERKDSKILEVILIAAIFLITAVAITLILLSRAA